MTSPAPAWSASDEPAVGRTKLTFSELPGVNPALARAGTKDA